MVSATFNEEKVISKLRWRILPYLMLLYIVAMMDRVNISFAALEMNKVLLGITTLIIMVDRPEQAKFLTKEEKEWLVGQLKQEHEAKLAKVPENKWKVFKEKRVWHLSFCYLCYVIALYGLGLWMPQIIKALSQKLSNTNIGLLSTITYMCGVVAMVLVARHSDKTMERRYHVALPISLAFFGLIGLTMTTDLYVAMVLLCVSTAAIYCFVGTFWSLPALFLTEATAAVGIAIINSTGNLGGFVGPYIVGYLKDFSGGSTTLSMYFLAAFALLGTLSVLALGKQNSTEAARKTNIPVSK